MSTQMNRRTFCCTAAGAALAPKFLRAASADPSAGRIDKAVKITMIPGKAPLLEKFQLAKEVGFDGVSLFAPDRFDLKEALQAQDKTGLMIHNVNNAVHWKQRLSDPDPEVRRESLTATKAALQFAHDVGASSILQVIGKVTDEKTENHEQVWQRSIAEIRKALPLAAKLGVRILCENVGNGFCETPKEWAAYLDEIASPWVGALYDIGNHHSHGGAHTWIPVLGTRIVKLDAKGHDSTIGRNCDILAGDVDWALVRGELAKLDFTGWATAEVRGGDRKRLREVVEKMDQALGIR